MRGVGKDTVVRDLSAIVAIEVILNLNVPFHSKTQYFRFRLLQLFK
jgi:hypothetical protein